MGRHLKQNTKLDLADSINRKIFRSEIQTLNKDRNNKYQNYEIQLQLGLRHD